jgi:hypothetical protein
MQNMKNHAAWFNAEPCKAQKGQAKMGAGQSSMGMGGTLISVSSTSVGAHCWFTLSHHCSSV